MLPLGNTFSSISLLSRVKESAAGKLLYGASVVQIMSFILGAILDAKFFYRTRSAIFLPF
jgi:hypothetical protein